MKRIAALLAIILLTMTVCAQKVTYTFTDNTIITSSGQHLTEAEVKRISNNISSLLTALNTASRNNTPLQLNGIQMTDEARNDLQYDWKHHHIQCDASQYAGRAVCDADGFQVRGINTTFLPTGSDGEQRPRELFICFNRSGQITEVNFAMSEHAVSRIMEDARSVTDEERRYTILKFVENFRQSYERKDIETLKHIFSDNALIITGRVVKECPSAKVKDKNEVRTKIVYTRQKKEEYIARMERKFKNVSYINVDFDDIEVEQCRVQGKTNFYGVTLIQHWKDSSYEDEGYLFLLWEFDETGEKSPIIHVRSWQPLMNNGKPLKGRERINMHDYKY